MAILRSASLATLLALGGPPSLPPLPTTIPSQLGPVPVSIVEHPCGDPGLFGCFDQVHRYVHLRRGLHPAALRQVYEHERIHVVLWDAGLSLEDPDEEDRIADALASARVAEILSPP